MREIVFSETNVSDNTLLKQIKRTPKQVYRVALGRCPKLTDAGFRGLLLLPNLRVLWLELPQFRDGHLSYVKSSLEAAILPRCDISDSGLAKVLTNHPQLESLDVSYTSQTGKCFEGTTELRLTSLNSLGCSLVGLDAICRAAPRLRHLRVDQLSKNDISVTVLSGSQRRRGTVGIANGIRNQLHSTTQQSVNFVSAK